MERVRRRISAKVSTGKNCQLLSSVVLLIVDEQICICFHVSVPLWMTLRRRRNIFDTIVCARFIFANYLHLPNEATNRPSCLGLGFRSSKSRFSSVSDTFKSVADLCNDNRLWVMILRVHDDRFFTEIKLISFFFLFHGRNVSFRSKVNSP